MTDWSGSTDFADASNSFPVSYSLTTIPRNVGPYRAGEVWAEPDIDHAAALMRHVAGNREAAQRQGRAARLRMQQDYSDAAIASLVRARLDVIGSRDRLGELRRELSAFVTGYQDLVESVRMIASQVVPPGAVVAVVTKGDSDFLTIEGRRAWHFPEARPGVYAGHHPADDAAALAALEEARARGANFLLLPGTAYWWLEHYAEFGVHLETRCGCAWRDARCTIYDLRQQAEVAP